MRPPSFPPAFVGSVLPALGFVLLLCHFSALYARSTPGRNIPVMPCANDTFPFSQRLSTFMAIDAQASGLWQSKRMKLLKTSASSLFPHLPVLRLYDRNGDRKAEEFAYSDQSRKESPEFGFCFDADGDHQPDYIVYNGGPLFTKDFSGMFWMNYHWIDSNGDGKIDIMVYNTVKLKGEEPYDEGISAWIYDRDFDGVFDSAEYLGRDFRQPIEKKNGGFVINTPMGEKVWKETEDMTFHNDLLKEVSSLFR